MNIENILKGCCLEEDFNLSWLENHLLTIEIFKGLRERYEQHHR